MMLPVLQQRPQWPTTSCAIRWWTPNATWWIPATLPSMSPRRNTRTPTVTVAAAAPCQGACADKCRALDASMMETGMVGLAPVIWCSNNAQRPPSESVTWVFSPLPLCPPSLQSRQWRVQTPGWEGPFELGSGGGRFIHQRCRPSGPGTPRGRIQETREEKLFYTGH